MGRENQLYGTDEIQERVVLIGVEMSSNAGEVEECLDELEELAATAGALTVGRVIQKREHVHPGHYMGKGKVEEVKIAIQSLEATGVICDDELSPAQIRNLEAMLETKIMDRTMLILDIFAARAQSREGKIQVELAQLKYRSSRLTGLGQSLSRLGGGIGTRGPGEKKLEIDRRHIRNRIAELNSELRDMETHRQILRDRRMKVGTPVVGIVGYTNAGKSTLLNLLTDAEVLAEDKLFATLDPTTRKVELGGGSEVLLTDTVGFIRKLPHHLIRAFHSTLEELQYADILLHVVDAANPQRENHMEVVYKTLRDLKCMDKPIITVYNKMDKDIQLPLPKDAYGKKTVRISAATGAGTKELLDGVEEILQASRKRITVLIPYTEGYLLNQIHGQCEIIGEEHTGEGVVIEAYTNEEMQGRLEPYLK